MAKVENKKKHLLLADEYIENFDLESNNYILLTKSKDFIIKNMDNSNKIYIKDNLSDTKYNIDSNQIFIV